MINDGGTDALTATLKQFYRYAVVGIATNLFGYAAYLAITALGMEPKIAMSTLYIGGATAAYFGNRQWTFDHQGSVAQSSAKYVLAHVSGYFLNLALLLVFADALGLPHQGVQGVAVFVVAIYLFLVFRLLVFPASRPTSEG